jgi:hypothetical protein
MAAILRGASQLPTPNGLVLIHWKLASAIPDRLSTARRSFEKEIRVGKESELAGFSGDFDAVECETRKMRS